MNNPNITSPTANDTEGSNKSRYYIIGVAVFVLLLIVTFVIVITTKKKKKGDGGGDSGSSCTAESRGTCYKNNINDSQKQTCTDGLWQCPDGYYLCTPDKAPTCTNNVLPQCTATGTWACPTGSCNTADKGSVQCMDAMNNPVDPVCNQSTKKYECPPNTCDKSSFPSDKTCTQSGGTETCDAQTLQYKCTCGPKQSAPDQTELNVCNGNAKGSYTCDPSTSTWSCLCNGKPPDESAKEECESNKKGIYQCDGSSWNCVCGNSTLDAFKSSNNNCDPICSSGSQWTCPCSGVDTSQFFCLNPPPSNNSSDFITITDAVCDTTSKQTTCQNASALLCPKPTNNAYYTGKEPIPFCYTWDPSAPVYVPGTNTLSSPQKKGNYVPTCPVYDTTKKGWTCKDYFLWGSNVPPTTLDNNITKDMSGSSKFKNTYYEGIYGKISDTEYDPNLGTLAFCQDQTVTPPGKACSSAEKCFVVQSNPDDSTPDYFVRIPDPSSKMTTGYRISSEANNPYFYIPPDNYNGDLYCNAYHMHDAADVTRITNVPGIQQTLEGCQAGCASHNRVGTQDPDCFMYIFNNDNDAITNKTACTLLLSNAPSSKSQQKFLRNLDAGWTSVRVK